MSEFEEFLKPKRRYRKVEFLIKENLSNIPGLEGGG